MTTEIKAKVLSFDHMDWGLYCGFAELKLLSGKNKGKTIRIPMVTRHKKGDKVTIYETEDQDETV
jgi:hypothetical protein